MFKKLDLLIIKAFVGPFLATFFVTLLVLVMQFFWLWIDDFVGKGLSTGVILEFIWYQSAVLVPLALPLAVLLSSLMTFGNLGESYELVAIKSAGISLLRFMRPLFVITILICGIAFLFGNNIIPVANLKSKTLLYSIVNTSPSFDIKEGVFYDKIDGFAIKIGKKEKNDTVIRDVIIYEQNNMLQDNFIVASDGVMRLSDNKRFLEFILRNGTRYQERGNRSTPNTEFIRLGFKEYKKQFDLSQFQFQRSSDSLYKNNQRMLSMRQLQRAIDSIQKQDTAFGTRMRRDVLGVAAFVRFLDSTWKKPMALPRAKSVDALIPDSLKTQVNQSAANFAGSMRINNEVVLSMYKDHQRDLRVHRIEWHKKIYLASACLILFLIGAPLGSIIRKGGLGSPLVFAIAFFMLFYFMSTTGEKSAKEGAMGVIPGMWLAAFILVPIGIFLTYKAMHDSQLFNKETYFRFGRKVRAFLKRGKAPQKPFA
ncbi:MAG TPA: LptF/LptG family permease [Chitinophagaceae bacterium]|nr:LptF/LptG family permease [Chitinophagaceae bacterium]